MKSEETKTQPEHDRQMRACSPVPPAKPMNKPNINAEVLPLPDGHRWVDIANEPFTRNARFWCGFWTDDYASSTTEYRQDWSYCIPIEQS